MKPVSPNLKPKQLHSHLNKAHTLGVPHSNVLDLRAMRKTQMVAELKPVKAVKVKKTPKLKPEPIIKAPKLPKIKTASWWKRTHHSKQKKLLPELSESTSVISPEPLFSKTLEPDFDLPEIALPPLPPVAKVPIHARLRQSEKILSAWQRTARSLAIFAVICVVIVAPFLSLGVYKQLKNVQAHVVNEAQAAVTQLNNGGQAASKLNFTGASQSFNQAASNFQDAQNQLSSVNALLAPVLTVLPKTNRQVGSAQHLVSAGKNIALAGQELTTAFQSITNVKAVLKNALNVKDDNANSAVAQPNVTDILSNMHGSLAQALPQLQQATSDLAGVDLNSVPAAQRDKVQFAQSTVPEITATVSQLTSLTQTLSVILGADSSKRYLVLFLNNRELRACGGFLGSFARIDINKGQVQTIDIPGGGPYDLMGNLTVHEVAPDPLHLVSADWAMQDSNWWADCPTSFQKVEWFYSKSGGSSVDGVIALTPDIIQQMLAITGPIDLTAEDGVTINHDNFYDTVQTIAEEKYDQTKQSKKVIADLTPKLFSKLFAADPHNLLPVLQMLYTALNQKNFILYFNDPQLEQGVKEHNWGGDIKSVSKDYLQVVDTNIAGGKTNGVIQQTIHHQAQVQVDGHVIDTVIITRTHNGKVGNALTGLNNTAYLRIYVPQGSKLIGATGFTQPDPKLMLSPRTDAIVDSDLQTISGQVLVDEASGTRMNNEFGKTVFGNWTEVDPGSSTTVTLQYELPFQLQFDNFWNPTDTYSLLVQKQPGSFPALVITNVIYPKTFSERWGYPSASANTPAGTLNQALTQDVFSGVVLAKQ